MAINDIPNLQFNNQTSNITPSQSQYGQTSRTMNNNLFQPQSIFMQPMGNIYGLGSSSEIGNIPIGNGVSAGLCLTEGTLYLKSMQSNGPAILGYKLTPLELVNQQNAVAQQSANRPQQERQEQPITIEQIEKLMQKYDAKIGQLSDEISNLQSRLSGDKGGSKKWEI